MAVVQVLVPLGDPHVQLSSNSPWRLPPPWGRGCTSTVGGPSSRFIWCHFSGASSRKYVELSSRKVVANKLWQEFFSDPSEWWDNRPEKVNPRYPDFTHKKTKQPLWIDNKFTPLWVEEELASMAPGTLQTDSFSWNVRLRRHVQAGDYEKTLKLYQQMQREGMILDKFTFIAVVNACSGLQCLEQGRRVHQQIILRGYEDDVYVATCLVDMYAKCRSSVDAWNIFSKMREQNVVSWSAMIGGYVKCGQGLKAMELFGKMQQEGVEPNAVTFVGVLNACTSVAALEEGRHVHQQIIQRGCESDIYVANSLVDMYAKCGSAKDAWSVFSKMREHNVVSWNAMIGGYVKSGESLKAMELFRKMQQEGVEPSAITFVGVLHACANVADLEEGRHVHEQIIERGYECNLYVANCLVDMYAKCGSMGAAETVFNNMLAHDVVSWSAMIGGYARSRQGQKAIEFFGKMQQEGVEPNIVTFVGVLNACASDGALKEGRHVHEQIIEKGYECNLYVANCLVDMYAKSGSVNDAWTVFNKMQEHDVVSWGAMIGGYVKAGQGLKAMELFQKMQQEGVEPSAVTFVGALNACAIARALDEGRRVHEQIIERGYEYNLNVANCLVDMYAKCGSMEAAGSVFNKMQEHDVVSWNTMIGGYAKSEEGLKAIELYLKMQQKGVEPSTFTFVSVLNACTTLLALEEGRHVHKQIIERGHGCNVYIANCLVDMYGKCGSIEDAWSVFKDMQNRDVVSWNAMIGSYAMHGHAKKAIGLFKWMGKEGLEVDGVTFTCLLSACNHAGLVKEGLRYFMCMTLCYDIFPTTDHYACAVDLLGRAGRLEEAEEIIGRMPVERDEAVWMALLGACRLHGNIEMAERAAKHFWELDPDKASGHVLLSNIYAAA